MDLYYVIISTSWHTAGASYMRGLEHAHELYSSRGRSRRVCAGVRRRDNIAEALDMNKVRLVLAKWARLYPRATLHINN